MEMRTYEEICDDLSRARPGKEARKLHKELRQYGDGVRLIDRYPLGYPVCVGSILGIVISILVISTVR